MIQRWTSASLATHRVTGHPEGGISGQSGIFERILLSCLKGLLVVRPEPVDVDLDHLGGVDELHQQPQDPHTIRCCISIQCALLGNTWILSSRFLRVLMTSENSEMSGSRALKGRMMQLVSSVEHSRMVEHSRTITKSQPC